MACIIGAVVVMYDQKWIIALLSEDAIPQTQPRPYAIAVYIALSMMVWGVHLRAVLWDRRQSSV